MCLSRLVNHTSIAASCRDCYRSVTWVTASPNASFYWWLILTLSHTVSKLSRITVQIADYCSNFGHFAFWALYLEGVGATYTVHFRNWKARNGLPTLVARTFLATWRYTNPRLPLPLPYSNTFHTRAANLLGFEGHRCTGQGHRDVFWRRHSDRRFAVEDQLVYIVYSSALVLFFFTLYTVGTVRIKAIFNTYVNFDLFCA